MPVLMPDRRMLRIARSGRIGAAELARSPGFVEAVQAFDRAAGCDAPTLVRIPSTALPALVAFLEAAVSAAIREPHGQTTLFPA